MHWQCNSLDSPTYTHPSPDIMERISDLKKNKEQIMFEDGMYLVQEQQQLGSNPASWIIGKSKVQENKGARQWQSAWLLQNHSSSLPLSLLPCSLLSCPFFPWFPSSLLFLLLFTLRKNCIRNSLDSSWVPLRRLLPSFTLHSFPCERERKVFVLQNCREKKIKEMLHRGPKRWFCG